MRAEAEPRPRRRRNESSCGAPVARRASWLGLVHFHHANTYTLGWAGGRQSRRPTQVWPSVRRQLRLHRTIVDNHVVDQTSEETARLQEGATANVQATTGGD
jgi:hypothetical protein